ISKILLITPCYVSKQKYEKLRLRKNRHCWSTAPSGVGRSGVVFLRFWEEWIFHAYIVSDIDAWF
ncbi:hypothetical protein ABTN70_19945, partial [Acinetobacter baumannii]